MQAPGISACMLARTVRATRAPSIRSLTASVLPSRARAATVRAMPKPSVLISNDDGIDAPGLVALTRALGDAELCTMYVAAPATEQSAKSQALTLGQPMVAEAHGGHPKAHSAFAIHGTPADAVMTALSSPLFDVRSSSASFATAWQHCLAHCPDLRVRFAAGRHGLGVVRNQ